MDTDKSSNPSKGPELSNVMAPEETALTDKGDRQREEEKEADTVTVDGSVAVAAVSQRRAQEKHRYNTMGYQKKKQRTVVDFSTVSKGTSAGGKTRGALKQVLFNQGASDKNGTAEDRSVTQVQVDALKLVLNSFNIPADLRWTWGEGGTERSLEDSWTDIVDSRVHECMTKTERHQQEALWELLNTELTYINKLTIAKDFVIAALSHCHGYGFLLEVSPTMLFSNLPSILDAHRLFWREVMYPMLQEARLTEQPFDPMKLEAGCLQFPERFPAYFEYCWEGDRNVEFARKQLDTNPQFHTYLTWVENHPQCGRMRLGDMQAKPHQRITKYPLLLKAVLKNTQNPPTQNALERMLNSVNNFLESINDYLHLKEALSVAAQRIEEHKIEGLSEEIDKHVRELCCFDLMSPMRGLGPNDIRKLLLEETLKVRGRKDNKELVVLLFTDVLLMTKTQRKSDKLKVVRPPLPLERLHCVELKDGCSFVLVEVGDLGCAVSVTFLSTPSPDSCSTWVSALRETQATLETLRRKETNKTLKITSELVGSEKPPIQNEMADKDMEVSVGQSDSERSDDEFDTAEYANRLRNERRRSETQILTDVEKGKIQQPAEDKNSPLIGYQNNQSKSAHEEAENGYWVEEAPLKKFNERRATWKHKEQASSNSNEITQLVRNGHSLLPGGHVEKNGTSSQFVPSTSSSNKPPTSTYGASVETGKPLLDPYNDSQGIRRQSLSSQPEDRTGFLTDSGRFVRIVMSPRLQRRQPNHLQPSVPSDSSKKAVNVWEITQYNANSNGNQRRASSPCITPHDSHRVLKLGSLKNKHETLWHVPEKRSSPDPETLSEPEQRPKENRQPKHKLKTQRSLSQSSHRRNLSPSPGMDNQLHPSTLQDALQRAKEREKERALVKRVGNTEERTLSVDNSSVSASPSPKEEKAAKHQEPAGLRMISAYGWREGNVDGSDDEKESVLEGVSVDWPGWCFDDEEVFDFEDFDDEEMFEQILTKNDLRSSEKKRSERHDEIEWSEV